MCGRYASFQATEDVAAELDVDVIDPLVDDVAPSWNIAPTSRVRMVVERPDAQGQVRRQIRVARWGLVPSWAKDPTVGARMFNARAETVAAKPAFGRAFAARRALLPADGYIEWQQGTVRQPYYVHPGDSALATFAGIFEFWKVPQPQDGAPGWLVSVAIITQAASGALADLHPRRPVVVPPDARDLWLSPATSVDEALTVLDLETDLAWHTVSTQVNSASNDSPDLLVPSDQV